MDLQSQEAPFAGACAVECLGKAALSPEKIDRGLAPSRNVPSPVQLLGETVGTTYHSLTTFATFPFSDIRGVATRTAHLFAFPPVS